MKLYPDEEFDREHANIEACIPAASDDAVEGIPGMKTLAPGLCATRTYRGLYSDFGKAYASVRKWIKDNHRQVVSAPFEIYMNSVQDVRSPENLTTQVWFPISHWDR